MATVYSNCIGIFLFKDKKLVEEKLFSRNEIILYCPKLEKGEIIPPEEALAKKHDAKIVGKEKVTPRWVLEILSDDRYREKIREANIIITKRKVAGSVKKDNLIIQSANSIEEADKVANNLSKRLREWYELYNPEFSKSIESHEKFAELIQQKTKKELLDEINICQEETMGADLEKEDLAPILHLAAEISNLFNLREKQIDYVEKRMKENLPNVTAVAGGIIGAKLLAKAGSLEKMALFPASTIQLLGAEKALFRHIKTGAKPPKYGVIINHPLVTQATEKGKAARVLADKISIAAKIDLFKGEFIGDKLRKALEEKLR
ncbi:Pre-mRNA processing ribonucleoprotein [Candidatus Woesearchaeota archaeon]|nr:Pre-mRNA processing ribonucleoprotein [Candidatus Woesearchaeota archaeon]